MRILITGGAGCLGSNLIEHWLPQDHQIFVIDNFATGKREVVPDVQGLTVCEGSIVNLELLNECFAAFKPQVVIHAAASYKDSNNWVEDSSTNVIGSANVAKMAKAHGAARLINFQTALCYGRPKAIPISNTHPTAPFSYGITKTAGEHFISVKKGSSNLAEAISSLENLDLIDRMVDRAYQDVIASGRYSYKSFVEMVDQELDKSMTNMDKDGHQSPLKEAIKVDANIPTPITTMPILSQIAKPLFVNNGFMRFGTYLWQFAIPETLKIYLRPKIKYFFK
ncbi:NAD-dependent epimerase/dehydratase family protein [Polynucleobacter necessarius]|uniref:NAD-dependent epimerase/dehydratase family protein n=1 Tax=Polynucleobacter necessarius TaxID=576610 RepID=UPI000E099CEE|nr:NAD-dependent epimerase/dehydratase family protein [Polynucleobacter necessarius]